MGLHDKVGLVFVVIVAAQVTIISCMPSSSRKTFDKYLSNFKQPNTCPASNSATQTRGIKPNKVNNNVKSKQNDMYKTYNFPEIEYPPDKSPREVLKFRPSNSKAFAELTTSKGTVNTPAKAIKDMKQEMRMKQKLKKNEYENFHVKREMPSSTGSDSPWMMEREVFPEVEYPTNALDTWAPHYWNPSTFTKNSNPQPSNFDANESNKRTIFYKSQKQPLKSKSQQFMEQMDKINEAKRIQEQKSRLISNTISNSTNECGDLLTTTVTNSSNATLDNVDPTLNETIQNEEYTINFNMSCKSIKELQDDYGISNSTLNVTKNNPQEEVEDICVVQLVSYDQINVCAKNDYNATVDQEIIQIEQINDTTAPGPLQTSQNEDKLNNSPSQIYSTNVNDERTNKPFMPIIIIPASNKVREIHLPRFDLSKSSPVIIFGPTSEESDQPAVSSVDTTPTPSLITASGQDKPSELKNLQNEDAVSNKDLQQTENILELIETANREEIAYDIEAISSQPLCQASSEKELDKGNFTLDNNSLSDVLITGASNKFTEPLDRSLENTLCNKTSTRNETYFSDTDTAKLINIYNDLICLLELQNTVTANKSLSSIRKELPDTVQSVTLLDNISDSDTFHRIPTDVVESTTQTDLPSEALDDQVCHDMVIEDQPLDHDLENTPKSDEEYSDVKENTTNNPLLMDDVFGGTPNINEASMDIIEELANIQTTSESLNSENYETLQDDSLQVNENSLHSKTAELVIPNYDVISENDHLSSKSIESRDVTVSPNIVDSSLPTITEYKGMEQEVMEKLYKTVIKDVVQLFVEKIRLDDLLSESNTSLSKKPSEDLSNTETNEKENKQSFDETFIDIKKNKSENIPDHQEDEIVLSDNNTLVTYVEQLENSSTINDDDLVSLTDFINESLVETELFYPCSTSHADIKPKLIEKEQESILIDDKIFEDDHQLSNIKVDDDKNNKESIEEEEYLPSIDILRVVDTSDGTNDNAILSININQPEESSTSCDDDTTMTDIVHDSGIVQNENETSLSQNEHDEILSDHVIEYKNLPLDMVIPVTLLQSDSENQDPLNVLNNIDDVYKLTDKELSERSLTDEEDIIFFEMLPDSKEIEADILQPILSELISPGLEKTDMNIADKGSSGSKDPSSLFLFKYDSNNTELSEECLYNSSDEILENKQDVSPINLTEPLIADTKEANLATITEVHSDLTSDDDAELMTDFTKSSLSYNSKESEPDIIMENIKVPDSDINIIPTEMELPPLSLISDANDVKTENKPNNNKNNFLDAESKLQELELNSNKNININNDETHFEVTSSPEEKNSANDLAIDEVKKTISSEEVLLLEAFAPEFGNLPNAIETDLSSGELKDLIKFLYNSL